MRHVANLPDVTMHRLIALVALLAVVAIGCGAADDADEVETAPVFGDVARDRLLEGGVSVDDIHEIDETSSGSAMHAPMSLCEVAWIANGGAGLFSVAAMGSIEEHNEHRGASTPFTYVELHRLEDWSGTAPEVLVVRFEGGYIASTGTGMSSSSSAEFRDGVVYGVMWQRDDDGFNRGFAHTYGPLVFTIDDDIVRPALQSMPQGLTVAQFSDIVRETYAALPPREHEAGGDFDGLPYELCPPQSRRVEAEQGARDEEDEHVEVPVEPVPIDE